MYRNYSAEQKINFIYSLKEKVSFSNDDWNKIVILSKDRVSEVRYRIAELLALFPSSESEDVLVSMLRDRNHMVRMSACDSLSFSSSQSVLKMLHKLACDRRYLVRGYAILSIADIQRNINNHKTQTIIFLKGLFAEETSEWVKVAIARSLYILGEYIYDDYLLSRLNSKYHKNRCFVLSLIKAMYDNDMLKDLKKVKFALAQRKSLETTIAVKSQLLPLIEEIHVE